MRTVKYCKMDGLCVKNVAWNRLYGSFRRALDTVGCS